MLRRYLNLRTTRKIRLHQVRSNCAAEQRQQVSPQRVADFGTHAGRSDHQAEPEAGCYDACGTGARPARQRAAVSTPIHPQYWWVPSCDGTTARRGRLSLASAPHNAALDQRPASRGLTNLRSSSGRSSRVARARVAHHRRHDGSVERMRCGADLHVDVAAGGRQKVGVAAVGHGDRIDADGQSGGAQAR